MIRSFTEISDKDISNCGGKGASLVKMIRHGLPVPEGYVVMPGTTDEEVNNFVKTLSSNYTYAVRSSALNEDGQQASFAGAYETLTDVPKEETANAVKQVISSADSTRVNKYAEAVNVDKTGIAVVIQRFVKPQFAGVVFTSDVITGSSARMTGNFVRGEGELLVSGEGNAEKFFFDSFKYRYDGPEDFKKYAKKLYRYCSGIRDIYGQAMDIEWAVSDGVVYILQARPVTTIKRGNLDTYEINGSYAGEYLLTRTNVGEIFMRPVSPVTFSVLEIICGKFGLLNFIDYINGQAYMNLSVLCSAMVALGFSKETAYDKIKDLGGNIPDGVKVPVFPMDKKLLRRKIFKLIIPKSKKASKGYTLSDADMIIAKIEGSTDAKTLRKVFDDELVPFINGGLGAIIKGVNVMPLFGTSAKITKLCGKDLGGRIMAGSLGVIDSMKPLLLLEDVADGKMTREEYLKACGHRHVNEMELASPYPFEDPDFPDNLIRDHKASGINVHKMKEEQEEKYREALSELCTESPSKAGKVRKLISKFVKANEDREMVRSEGVKIFVALRKYLLKAGGLTGVGDDIFLLYIDEVLKLLEGDEAVLANIESRRQNYTRYLEYPPFPNLIYGRFDPDKWISDDNRRSDYFGPSEKNSEVEDSETVTGFAGASGVVTGTARVIYDISEAEKLQDGEILVTTATNIGWTVIFPKASAVVTDIGAPLSHAAIVAREFGIPAVVGCGNATTLIRTGDKIKVDGAAGTVKIIK